MSLPATSSAAWFCDDIVKRAMVKCNRLGIGQDPDPDELVFFRGALWQEMLALQDEGFSLCQIDRETLDLEADTEEYELEDDTLTILPGEVTVLVGTTFQRVQVISRGQYYQKPDRETTTGIPVQVMLRQDRTAASGNHTLSGLCSLFVYPVPDDDYVLHYTRVRAARDLTSALSDVDGTRRMGKMLVELLAASISPDCGLTMAERADLLARSMASKKVALRGDREPAPTRFYPRPQYRR